MQSTRVHVTDPGQLYCPECEADAGEACVRYGAYGNAIDMPEGEYHEGRVWLVDMHEVLTDRVPDSDVVVEYCVECDWEDAR